MKKKIFTVSVMAIVAVMLMMLLVACVPSPEKAKENLEEAGYIVVAKENVLGCETYLSATKVNIGTAGVGGEHVTIYYFKDSATAKEKLAEIEKVAGEDAVKISGKAIYYGTEQALKDMK